MLPCVSDSMGWWAALGWALGCWAGLAGWAGGLGKWAGLLGWAGELDSGLGWAGPWVGLSAAAAS